MESENFPESYADNRAVVSRQSVQSTKKDSQSLKNYKLRDENEKREVDSRSKTRICHSDPDRDHTSDEESRRSKESYYSDDYESQSECSLSPYARSRSPSPQRKETKLSPPHKTASVGRKGAPRPQRGGRRYASQQLHRGADSQSKGVSPPKDLDLVTKRMLSARLLKINELRNALTELQQRTNELQKENRVLRQLQLRQEKALHRYDDTESEISQLISRHSNEIHVLRERLRRTQERERTVERRLKESEEQLTKSQATVARLKKLVNQQDLGQRDELSRKLDEEKGLRQEAERKIKELERSIELSISSFQRQLVSEKKRTLAAQEVVRSVQEEQERLTNKLKEKDRELDVKNIYSNRLLKPSQRKDAESGTKRKLVSSKTSTVAVQTEDRQELASVGFPTPPPAIIDSNENDEYFSLKELNKDVESHTQTNQSHSEVQLQEKAKDQERNNKQQSFESNLHRETDKAIKEECKKELKTDVESPTDSKEKSPRPGRVAEDVQRLNQETLVNQQEEEEEARLKKKRLLAKMREIDQQNQTTNNHILNVSNSIAASEQRSPRSSIFSLSQTDNVLNTSCESKDGIGRRSERESGGLTTGLGRRAFRTQASDDLAFGNYAPSFGHASSRGMSHLPQTPPKEDKGSALEAIGVFSLKKTDSDKEKDFMNKVGEKDRKSILMQQLFGNIATIDNVKNKNKDILDSPPSTNGVRSRREGLQGLHSGSHTPPAETKSTIQVVETKPAVRAIASFDEDIEELTL
ncbi:unnamed protein product [Knipowitschia caucasica]